MVYICCLHEYEMFYNGILCHLRVLDVSLIGIKVQYFWIHSYTVEYRNSGNLEINMGEDINVSTLLQTLNSESASQEEKDSVFLQLAK